MKLYYDSHLVGEIPSDKPLNLQDACQKLGIDLYNKAMNWDWDLFFLDSELTLQAN